MLAVQKLQTASLIWPHRLLFNPSMRSDHLILALYITWVGNGGSETWRICKDHLMCTHLFAMGKNIIVLVKQKHVKPVKTEPSDHMAVMAMTASL